MLVYIHTGDVSETRTVNISNLPQLIDYLQNNELALWNSICDKELVYAVVDSTGEFKEQVIRPEIFNSDLSDYDILIIAERIEGEALFTSIALGITAMATSIGVSAAAAGIIGYVGAALVMVGVSMAIGAIVQMLSPTNTINSDPSSPDQAQKNYTFNGIPNIREQGGAVPMIFGECLFGGVLISADLYTSTANLTFTGVTSVSNAEADSIWRRIVAV